MSFITDNLYTILTATVILLLYLFIKKKLEYFSTSGIPYVKPTLMEFIRTLTVSGLVELPNEIYKKARNDGHPIIGFFRIIGPAVLAVDPDLVEKILIKDFSHFHDHGLNIDTKIEPLFGHLFIMKGDQWRTLRNKLLPTFTSGKLKGMVSAMEECALTLIHEIKNDINLRKDTNLKELFKSYSISVIARCVFAINPEGIKDPDCEFRRLLSKISKPSFLQLIKTFIAITMPKITKLFKVKFTPKEIDDFFINLTRDALEMRKASGIKRNDFVELLLELKEKGTVQVDVRDLEEDEKQKTLQVTQMENNSELEITDELLAAQAFAFIAGGFDNTSYLAAVTMYVLSKHKDVQVKVRHEVKEALRKHGGMNYLALKDMQLLDASINEALRLYPAKTSIFRECNKNITLDNGMTIEKGMHILIPTIMIQNDNKYWTDPELFLPERFIESDITPGTYLPFGDGPRVCIAQRLALLMTKVIIAELLDKFELNPSGKTKEPLKLIQTSIVDADGGFWGTFEPLNKEFSS